jgi:hypothetical protein
MIGGAAFNASAIKADAAITFSGVLSVTEAAQSDGSDGAAGLNQGSARAKMRLATPRPTSSRRRRHAVGEFLRFHARAARMQSVTRRSPESLTTTHGRRWPC